MGSADMRVFCTQDAKKMLLKQARMVQQDGKKILLKQARMVYWKKWEA